MRIIPVLDILNGQVVHGVKGDRDKYVPVRSLLTASSHPLDVARAFNAHFSVDELYIADLDAIIYQKSSYAYLAQILSEIPFKIMLDAGITEPNTAEQLLKAGVNKVIIGTETLTSLDALQQILDAVSPDNIIVSLDLREGRIVSHSRELIDKSALEIVHFFETMGIQELIILELTRIGSAKGVMTPLLRDILQESSLSIITGGGTRNIKDLKELKKYLISGVLIATALHSGTVNALDLASL